MALPIITSLTFSSGTPPQGPLESTATIAGSGFGASQGSSLLMIQDQFGELIYPTPVSWSATSITVVLSSLDFSTIVGQTRCFTLVLGGEFVGVRTPDFVIAANPTPIAILPQDQPVIYSNPVSMGYPTPPEGPQYPSRGTVAGWEGGTNYSVNFLPISGPPVLEVVALERLAVIREPLLTYTLINGLFQQRFQQ